MVNSGPYAGFVVDGSYCISPHLQKRIRKVLPQKPEYPSDTNGAMELALNYPKFEDVERVFGRFV